MTPADRLATGTLRLLKPPPRLSLPDWVEAEFRLPERSSAQPGRFSLWKYRRGWLEAIGDPLVPRVTLMKAARLGFSKCLIATIGSYACNDPCSVILLVPTDDDARGIRCRFSASPPRTCEPTPCRHANTSVSTPQSSSFLFLFRAAKRAHCERLSANELSFKGLRLIAFWQPAPARSARPLHIVRLATHLRMRNP
jgi:Phage terminase large subunit (GpA)